LWARILGEDAGTIEQNDNFFQIGGDSLRAVLLMLAIEETFGKSISPAVLREAPSLAAQAAAIEAAGQYQGIYAHHGGSGPPWFFVHPANTGPDSYRELAALLPARPFFAFEHYNLRAGSGEKLKGIQELAALYTEYMREIAPQGPYWLGGWSFGGLVALEMALGLEAAGETVAGLYLVDPAIVAAREERELMEKLQTTPHYREYLQHDPRFEHFRQAGMLDRLIENNQLILREVVRYLPSASLRGPAVLFRMTKPEPINPQTAPTAAATLRRLQNINASKTDNGFGAYLPRLRIIPVAETHDLALLAPASLAAIAAVMRDT
jgi:thioesterase domain-containing protein/acyl carrier protein